jgi:hypothetical protein
MWVTLWLTMLKKYELWAKNVYFEEKIWVIKPLKCEKIFKKMWENCIIFK